MKTYFSWLVKPAVNLIYTPTVESEILEVEEPEGVFETFNKPESRPRTEFIIPVTIINDTKYRLNNLLFNMSPAETIGSLRNRIVKTNMIPSFGLYFFVNIERDGCLIKKLLMASDKIGDIAEYSADIVVYIHIAKD